MIQIENKILSTGLFEEKFICNLPQCFGTCCIYGDSGAPLEKDEARNLVTEIKKISKYLTIEGVKAISKQGAWVTDADGDTVTPLIDGEECAYTVFEEGIAKCGIEIAFNDNAIPFQKPISCHLYPIRVSKVGENTAINYHRWHICLPARELGEKAGVPVFRFLKTAIIRVWGSDFYDKMEKVYSEINQSKNSEAAPGSVMVD